MKESIQGIHITVIDVMWLNYLTMNMRVTTTQTTITDTVLNVQIGLS